MKRFLIPAVLLIATSCARDDTRYPSLAPRATEARGFAEPAAPPPAAPAPDPALDASIAALTKRLDAIATGFAADAARAGKAADARGARTTGSEGWIAAQTALAALDDWRAQTGGVASDIDDSARTRAETVGTPYPALDALRARVDAETQRQADTIAALSATVPTR